MRKITSRKGYGLLSVYGWEMSFIFSDSKFIKLILLVHCKYSQTQYMLINNINNSCDEKKENLLFLV